LPTQLPGGISRASAPYRHRICHGAGAVRRVFPVSWRPPPFSPAVRYHRRRSAVFPAPPL